MNDAPPTITAEALLAQSESSTFVIDARGGGSTQIYGALRYDPRKIVAAPALALPLPKGEGTIVVYGQGDRDTAAREVAEKLRAAGYGKVYLLEGGFAAWEQAGGRTSELTLEQPVPALVEE